MWEIIYYICSINNNDEFNTRTELCKREEEICNSPGGRVDLLGEKYIIMNTATKYALRIQECEVVRIQETNCDRKN